MQSNHQIRKRFNEVIYNVARYAEIAFSIIILLAIASQVIPLLHELTQLSLLTLDMDFFTDFLAESLSLVVGLEFVKMLCRHTADTLVEVLMFAIARQMIVEHLSTLETLIGVLAIAVLFAIRKYLLLRPAGTHQPDKLQPKDQDALLNDPT
ncbi:MAG: transporter [Blautia sp.]|jgi:hypothetical protein